MLLELCSLLSTFFYMNMFQTCGFGGFIMTRLSMLKVFINFFTHNVLDEPLSFQDLIWNKSTPLKISRLSSRRLQNRLPIKTNLTVLYFFLKVLGTTVELVKYLVCNFFFREVPRVHCQDISFFMQNNLLTFST